MCYEYSGTTPQLASAQRTFGCLTLQTFLKRSTKGLTRPCARAGSRALAAVAPDLVDWDDSPSAGRRRADRGRCAPANCYTATAGHKGTRRPRPRPGPARLGLLRAVPEDLCLVSSGHVLRRTPRRTGEGVPGMDARASGYARRARGPSARNPIGAASTDHGPPGAFRGRARTCRTARAEAPHAVWTL